MENQKIGIVLIEGVSKKYFLENSAKYPEINTFIKEGNSTKLLKRNDSSFFTSILGLARVENLKDTNVTQTYLEELYYNVNIKGEYKNIYHGMQPTLITNDKNTVDLLSKYKFPTKLDSLDSSFFPKFLASEEFKNANPIIFHVNCDKIGSADKIDSGLKIVIETIKILRPTYRTYLFFYPFEIEISELIPQAKNPYISHVIPTQSYHFYKSDKVKDLDEKHAGVLVEWVGTNCRVDEFDCLSDLVNNKKRPGCLWMLAEQFMRTVAFNLGFVGKFGA